ncbi:MAG: efflux RND transporter periplasmic adaptor subunit [Ruminococcaceae bacterium]|nr:efflux RND transporter periplasmic adaptor subunit [Oscillospiraceae bacterium]
MPKEKIVKQRTKKTAFIIAAISIIIICVVFFAIKFLSSENAGNRKVYVSSVSEITGLGYVGFANRYLGVVESQDILELKIDSDRELDEIFVEVGDEVKEGDKLYSLKTENIVRQMRQVELDIEGMKNTVKSNRDEIVFLEKEKSTVPAEHQIDYTLQIQSLLANISQTDYSIKTKQLEYEQLKKSLESSVITSTLSGTVQTINEPKHGSSELETAYPAFMIIVKGGDFRVKGTISELNIHSISLGMPVILRSKIDEQKTWKGTIIEIDMGKPQSSGDDKFYYGPESASSSASKYSFYTDISSTEGLMIGQHLTIEPDLGQGTQNEGLWLPSFFLVDIDSSPFVFADNGNGKLVKKPLELGEYDESLDSYEIISGITLEDFIAFPEPDLVEGMPTTKEFSVPDTPNSDMMIEG